MGVACNSESSPAIRGWPVFAGLTVVVLFLLWLLAADLIYRWTLGPQPPQSIGAFARDVLTTHDGWIMIGVGVGYASAVVALAISVVSFPLLLDRNLSVDAAIPVSVRSVRANPGPLALWGLIVTAGLVIGSIPFLLRLVVVLPVLGHATWHLYRALVRG